MEEVLEQADSLYDIANEEYYDGNYKDAERGFLFLRSFLEGAQLDTSRAFAKTTWKLGDVYRRLRTHEESLFYYVKTEQLYRNLPAYTRQPLDLADIQIDRARVYSQMYEPQRAIAAYDSSLVVFRNHYGEEHGVVANTLMNSAIDLMKSGLYNDAEKRLLKAFDIFKVVSDSTSKDFGRIYSNLGYLYRKRGDYGRSLTYGKKALEIKLLHYDKNHPSVATYQRNIGKALLALNRKEEAIPYFMEAYRIVNQRLGPEHQNTVGALGELADAYAESGAFEQALKIYKRTGKMLEKSHPPTHPYRVAYTFNVGMLHEDRGDYDEAILAYQKARKDLSAAPEPPAILLADAEEQIARAYMKAGQPGDALFYIDTALARLAPSLVEIRNATDKRLPVMQAEANVLELLETRAEAYAQRALAGDTLEALNTIEFAVLVVKKLRESYPTEQARQFLRNEVSDLYELGVLLAHRLYQSSGNADYLNRALELSDAAKSGMLKDNFREQQARALAGIPESEAERVEQLAAELRDRRSEYGKSVSETTTKRLSDAAIAYQDAETQLRIKYPKYAFLKGSNNGLNIKEIQTTLKSNEVFIDYVLVDSYCFIHVVRNEGIEGFEIALPEDFYDNLKSTINAFRNPELNSKSNQGYTIAVLEELYASLFELIRPQLAGKDALLISPWGVLHQLPFAALVQSETHDKDYRTADYLVKDYAISYHSNISLLLQNPAFGKDRSALEKQLLGVAPEFGTTTGEALADATRQNNLAKLPFAAIELAGISSYFSAMLLEGQGATEASFVEQSNNYRMLHLASHGLLNNDEPLSSGIYFSASGDPASDDFLSAAEIYGLDLSADLAVLSACNTGAGRLQSGEGVLSLAHAFQYAGCKSVVASSWLANDQSTADITTEFYAQLTQGMPKNEALRQAKLHYLETADALSAHPFFWAGLTLRGDVGAVAQTGYPWWMYTAGLAMLAVGLLYFRRKG